MYDRLSSFCLQSANGRFIDDEYRSCMFRLSFIYRIKLSLQIASYIIIVKLVESNFFFPRQCRRKARFARMGNDCPPAPELLAALLSVKAPATAASPLRHVAHFLFQSLALRSVFLMHALYMESPLLPSKAVSFWLRFVTRNEREQLNS